METRSQPAKEPITGDVLAWAIDESGFAASDLAERLKVSPDSIEAWTSESASPTVGQLTKLSNVLKRPRVLFFAPHPPKDRIAPEYRHVNTDEGRRGLGSEELLTIRRAKRVQSIVAEIRADSGVCVEPIPAHTATPPRSCGQGTEELDTVWPARPTPVIHRVACRIRNPTDPGPGPADQVRNQSGRWANASVHQGICPVGPARARHRRDFIGDSGGEVVHTVP